MKKYAILTIALLAVLLTSCAQIEGIPIIGIGSGNSNAEFLDKPPSELFDSALAEATCIVYAEMLDSRTVEDITNGKVTQFDFKVLKEISGQIGVDMFSTKADLSHFDYGFEKGSRYILPLTISHNIYKGGTQYYLLGSCVEFSADDKFVEAKVSTGRDENVTDTLPAKADSLSVISQYAASKATRNEAWGKKHIESDNLNDIVSGAECVVQVKIGELFDRHYVDIYEVEVGKVYKGNPGKLKYCLFFLDTVKSGEEYILSINIDREWGWLVSEKNSLIPVNDTKMADEAIKLATAK